MKECAHVHMLTFSYCIIKEEIFLVMIQSWAKNKVSKTVVFAFKENECIFYIFGA